MEVLNKMLDNNFYGDIITQLVRYKLLYINLPCSPPFKLLIRRLKNIQNYMYSYIHSYICIIVTCILCIV